MDKVIDAIGNKPFPAGDAIRELLLVLHRVEHEVAENRMTIKNLKRENVWLHAKIAHLNEKGNLDSFDLDSPGAPGTWKRCTCADSHKRCCV